MIKAKVVKQSKHWKTGKLITTFEVEMHRFVLPEKNTHKMLSKNSASSRAVPIQANIEYIKSNTAYPVHWGANQAGMVAEKELPLDVQQKAIAIWDMARDDAIRHASALHELGVHKQVANRLIENFSYQKVVVTGTEWDNFFWLRNHKDAQPEIKELANIMLVAYNEVEPEILFDGEWHLPYVESHRNGMGDLEYFSNGVKLTLEDAIKVSSSCCAQVSYRKADDTLDKANRVYDMLNLMTNDESARKHSSPVEHQATPISYSFKNKLLARLFMFFGKQYTNGITHIKFDGSMWSANFQDFIQYRHLVPNESCTNHPDIKE